MIAKPKLSNAQLRANQLYQFMMNKSFVTKEQICDLYGWKYNSNNERRVREIIALLATKKPVVATSDNKGYKIASSKDEAQHTYNELVSRITEISKRLEPLKSCFL